MLKYIGSGDWLVGIPARDLTRDEIKEIEARFGYTNLKAFLLDSGLYEEEKKEKVEEKPTKKVKKEDSDGN